MPQIVADIPPDQLEQLSRKAEAQQLSVSEYLGRLIERELAGEWPVWFRELAGSWEGDLERPAQGEQAERESLDS